MISTEKEKQLIALDDRADCQLRHVQDLPAEWLATLKSRMASKSIRDIPLIDKIAIRLIEKQVYMTEQRIQEQAHRVEAARRSYKEATAETSQHKLENWKQELSRLEGKLKQVRVEMALQLKQTFPSI